MNNATVVLVHGAFADGSSWGKVIALLEKAGYDVIAVQNPLTSFADDVATTRRVIDAKPHTDYLARYANDAQGTSKQKGIHNNSEYVEDNDKVFIVATKDIPAGSEILVSYGKGYWNVGGRCWRLPSANRGGTGTWPVWRAGVRNCRSFCALPVKGCRRWRPRGQPGPWWTPSNSRRSMA